MSTPSLLNIPYLYKAGTLYSQIPESGAGDFTVSRTTTVANRSTRINKDGFVELVANNVPRLDYPVGGAVNGCPALLVEPAATNLVLQSENFGTTWSPVQLLAFGSGSVLNTTATLDPYGTNVSDLIVANATLGQHRIDQTITHASGSYVFSVFLKRAGYGFGRLRIGLAGATFDLVNGTISATDVGIVSSIQSYGNDWYRCIVSKAASAANEVIRINMQPSAIGGDFEGDGTSGIYVFGAQYETGSVPTSYIPTTTAAVTRSEDQITRPSVSSLIGQTEGTFYFEGEAEFVSADLPMINRNITNSIMFYRNSSNRLAAVVYYGGANFIFTTSTAITGPFKMAIAYKQGSPGDTALFVNGVQAGTTNTANWAFTAALTEVVARSEGWVGGTKPYKVRALGVYPNRIPNTAGTGVLSLQSLTTP